MTLGTVADQGEGVVLEVVLLREVGQHVIYNVKSLFVVGTVTHEKLLLGPVLTLWSSNLKLAQLSTCSIGSN